MTEVCTGGEIAELLVTGKDGAGNAIPRPKKRDVMLQIFRAVSYCHNMKIVHRDLKLENCLLKDQQADSLVKVIDFGYVFDIV